MSCVPAASRGVLASSVPADDLLAVVDFDVRLLGQVVDVEDLAVVVLDDDLRVQVALVLHDDAALGAAAASLLLAERLAFDRCPRSGPCRRPRPGSACCAGPTGRATWPGLTCLAVLDQQHRRRWGPCTSRARGPSASTMMISPLRVEDDVLRPASLVTTVDAASNLTVPPFLALISLSSTSRWPTPPMWNVRIVSCVPGSPIDWAAMMPTAMPSSTSAAGGQVHAVAAAADAERRLAGHRAADQDLVEAQLLDLAGDLVGDHLVLVDDHLVGDRVDDRVARLTRPRIDVGQARLRPSRPCRSTPLVTPCVRAAVVHRDDDVLGHVGQLAGQVAGVGRLEGRVGQALAGAVRRAEVLQHASGLRGSSP